MRSTRRGVHSTMSLFPCCCGIEPDWYGTTRARLEVMVRTDDALDSAHRRVR